MQHTCHWRNNISFHSAFMPIWCYQIIPALGISIVFVCVVIFSPWTIWLEKSLFLGYQLTISQHSFRLWLGAEQAPSHYLNQCWPSSPTHTCGLGKDLLPISILMFVTSCGYNAISLSYLPLTELSTCTKHEWFSWTKLILWDTSFLLVSVVLLQWHMQDNGIWGNLL